MGIVVVYQCSISNVMDTEDIEALLYSKVPPRCVGNTPAVSSNLSLGGAESEDAETPSKLKSPKSHSLTGLGDQEILYTSALQFGSRRGL